MQKKVLIACYSRLHSDPRVLVQIKSLAEYYVLAAGFSEPQVGESEFIELDEPAKLSPIKKVFNLILLMLGLDRWVFRSAEIPINGRRLSERGKFDLIIISDLDILPCIVKSGLSGGTRLVFDAHEYYLDFNQGEGLGKYYNKLRYASLLKEVLKMATHMATVSPGLKELYTHRSNMPIDLIKNLPAWVDLEVKTTQETIRLVHHGGALPKRQLELMIELMALLPMHYELYLYLMVQPHHQDYFNQLKTLAARTSPRIHFVDPVSTVDIAKELNQYDVGIFLLPPANLNYKYALPNKLFEFIQARLMVVTGPSPDMRDIITEEKVGVVSKTFEVDDFAKTLLSLSVEDIDECKRMSARVAKKYSFSSSRDQWRSIATSYLN